MKVIENQTFDMERALYGSDGVLAKNCCFDGPADGESALEVGGIYNETKKQSSLSSVRHCLTGFCFSRLCQQCEQRRSSGCFSVADGNTGK